jgi:hypothetical protein
VVVVNGILHVLASPDIYHDDIIHSFDLESESWKKTLEDPQKAVGRELWNKTTAAVRVAELTGFFCIVQAEAQLTNIWFLTESNNWVKRYTIPRAPNTYLHMPLGMTHDGGKLIFKGKV